MPSNYDSIDLDWTIDGDFMKDSSGDLKDTSEDLLLSFKNEVFTIIKSDLKEWREDLNVGAGLDDFIGEPNSKEIAARLEDHVKSALLLIASSSDLNIRVIPVGVYKVLITVNIQVLATVDNGLQAGEGVSVTLLFDYMERGTFVPLDDLNKFGNRTI